MRENQKLEECVEDLALNLPSLLGHGQFPRSNFLKDGLLQQEPMNMNNAYAYGVSSKLIEKILFEKGFKLNVDTPFRFERNYSSSLEFKSFTEGVLKGIGLGESEREKLPSIFERVGVVKENGIVVPYVYKTKDMQFYHGFDTEIKKNLFNELLNEDAVYNFALRDISFSTSPTYANEFGKVVLSFGVEKYQESKLDELKKFKKFLDLTSKKENDRFGYSVYKGNIYLGKKDKRGFFYQFGPNPEFSLSSNRKFVFNNDKVIMPPFSERPQIVEHSTNFEYDEEMFSELDLDNISTGDRGKLLGFSEAEPTEIRMNFDSSYISSNALTGIYLPKNKIKEMSLREGFEKRGEDYFFNTKRESVPVYFTDNIPRKINRLSREQYFE